MIKSRGLVVISALLLVIWYALIAAAYSHSFSAGDVTVFFGGLGFTVFFLSISCGQPTFFRAGALSFLGVSLSLSTAVALTALMRNVIHDYPDYFEGFTTMIFLMLTAFVTLVSTVASLIFKGLYRFSSSADFQQI